MFNKKEHDKDLSEPYKSFANLRLNDEVQEKDTSSQELETEASNQHEPPKELRKPIGLIMRRTKSQIIGDPIDHVQISFSLRLQGHTALISEVEPKPIDDAM